jgi:N-acyl-L-homoserine lactone synthetase
MLVCVSWETAHCYGEAWISHHRLRHRIFVDRQGWQVPTYNGLEYDQFDTPAARYILWLDERGQTRGAARLIPTIQPYMVKSLWPELVDGPLPESPCIWEATRFGCDRDLAPRQRRHVIGALIYGCQEFGLANNITNYLGVMPLSIFRHVIAAAGCVVRPLGRTRRMGQHEVGAAYVGVSAGTLSLVRSRLDVHETILTSTRPASHASCLPAPSAAVARFALT